MSVLTLGWRQERLISESWAGPVSTITPIAAVIGPPGPPGPQGPPGSATGSGPVGPAGPVGPVGPVGPAGASGATGSTGAAGSAGATGATGPTGAIGATGAAGSQGQTGAAGAQGQAGPVAAISTIEVDLGTPARRAGRFTIAGSAFVPGSAVAIWQAPGPYTGKGFSSADEAQMDDIDVTAAVTSTVLITAFWKCRHRVRGNVKFHYQTGA